MKKYKYEVIYLNGKVETFICNGYREAIIKATAFAYEQGWDSKINCVISEKGETIENISIDIDFRFVNVHSKFLQHAKIMQFTGLLDKNGREIYESDLVKLYHKGEWVVCEIVWNEKGMWSLKWKDGYINNYWLNPESYTVVGNIYEK